MKGNQFGHGFVGGRVSALIGLIQSDVEGKP